SENLGIIGEILKHLQTVAGKREQARRFAAVRYVGEKPEQLFSGIRLVGKRSVHKVEDNDGETMIAAVNGFKVAEGPRLRFGTTQRSSVGLDLLKNCNRLRFSILPQDEFFFLEIAKVGARFIAHNRGNQDQFSGGRNCRRSVMRGL